MRKVYVNVVTRLIVQMEDHVAVDNVINEMDYGFNSMTDGAEIVDTEIQDFAIMDSK